ncbi:MAG: magnesium/cobalt transporter CorA [Coriobacteriia bacterium]|nr:magnesium/cobalt transporter CorA [Coriobacteriia bacterium]
MAAQVTVRWLEDGQLRSSGIEAVGAQAKTGCVWVDVLGPEAESLERIAKAYGLHPLAVEDCLHFPQRPKLDSYDGTVFLIWLSPVDVSSDDVRMHEIDAFLRADMLITVHRDPSEAVDLVAEEAAAYLQRGTDWTLHAILDRLTDSVFPLVDSIGDELEDIEDAMLEVATREHLEALHRARRVLVRVHKMIGPERDVLRGLARERNLVSEEAYHYFTDVGDHLARVEDALDTYREVAASTMDVYLSSVSNRMNEIMKQLTVVATIFMPLTLITGIYGMNFRYLPELQWRFGYFGVLASMAAVVAVMLLFFKRRGWW